MNNKSNPNWTPEKVNNKKAESLQLKFYGVGAVCAFLSWASISNGNSVSGIFVFISIASFAIGSGIKTTWVKNTQLDIYVKDKAREQLRFKCYIAGIICAVIAFLTIRNNSLEAGGIFALASGGSFLMGGLLPFKWIKRGEAAGYK